MPLLEAIRELPDSSTEPVRRCVDFPTHSGIESSVMNGKLYAKSCNGELSDMIGNMFRKRRLKYKHKTMKETNKKKLEIHTTRLVWCKSLPTMRLNSFIFFISFGLLLYHLVAIDGHHLEADNQAVRITIQPNDLIAIEGESAELNCDAEGEPEPTIEWYHNGHLIKSSSNSRTTLAGSIQFLNIRPGIQSSLQASKQSTTDTKSRHQLSLEEASDAGVYYCLARNQHGEAKSRTATLQVACKYPAGCLVH